MPAKHPTKAPDEEIVLTLPDDSVATFDGPPNVHDCRHTLGHESHDRFPSFPILLPHTGKGRFVSSRRDFHGNGRCGIVAAPGKGLAPEPGSPLQAHLPQIPPATQTG